MRVHREALAVTITSAIAAGAFIAQPTGVGGPRGCVTDAELRRVIVAETSMQEFATITGATPRNHPRTVLRFRGRDGNGPMWSSIDLRYARCGGGQPTLLVTFYATTSGRLVYARSAKKWWPW